MGRFGIDLDRTYAWENETETFARYFNAADLVNTAPSCVIPVKVSAITTFNSDQSCVEMLGAVLSIEAEKLGSVASTVDYLEETLTTLYHPDDSEQ